MRNIFHSTKGIVFLGTPDEHIDIKCLRDLLYLPTPYAQSKNSPIYNLPKVLASIHDVQKRFSDLLKREDFNICIASFFEALPLVGLGQVILSLHHIMHKQD